MRKSRLAGRVGLAGVLTLAASLHAEQPGLPPDAVSQQAVVPLPQTVVALIKSLDDDSFAERQRATRQLQDAVVCSDEMLVTALKTEGLSLEQRTRLMSVFRERFEKSDRAAIGIQFRQGMMQPCIGAMIPKFPAEVEGVLRPGDVFLEVDGMPILPSISSMGIHEDLIGLISSYSPGDRVPMRIFRPRNLPGAVRGLVNGPIPVVQNIDDLGEGDTLDVVVPMGRRSDLSRGPDAREGRADRDRRLAIAWRYKLSRLGIKAEAGEPIEVAPVPDSTGRTGRSYNMPNVRMTPGPTPVGERDGQRQFVAMDFDPVRRQQVRILNNAQVMQRARLQIFASDGNQIRFSGDLPSALVIPETPGSPDAGPPAVPDDVGTILARVERARVELAESEKLARAAATPADRAAHARTIVRLAEEIEGLESQLDGLLQRSAARVDPD